MEPDYQGYAEQFNPIGDMANNARSLAVSRQLAAQHLGGQQIADGDYAGASNTLYSSGDLAGGQLAKQQGGQIGQAEAIAKRDYTGAATAAGAVGDVAGVKDAQATGIQQFQLQHQYLQQLTPILQAANAKAGAAGITHALDTVAPELQQLGVPADRIAEYRQAATANPDGFLQGINALAQPLQWEKTAHGYVAKNAAGTPIREFIESSDTTLNNPDGSQSVVRTPGAVHDLTGAAPGGPQMAASAPATLAAAQQPQGAAGGVAPAILAQESGNNPKVPPSVDGAIGPAQIKPATFAQYAQPGEDINNPADNVAVSKRILADLTQKTGGDPARIAVGYFSGPGNIAPAGSPTPWKQDLKDGNGKSVSGYVGDIISRLRSGDASLPQQATGVQVLATTSTGRPEYLPGDPAYLKSLGYAAGLVGPKGDVKDGVKLGEVMSLSPDAIDKAAQFYRVNKEIPGVGAGPEGAQARQAIINRAEQMDAQEGVTPEQALAKVNNAKAAQASLVDSTKQLADMEAYVDNARRDGQRVMDLAKKVASDHPTWLGRAIDMASLEYHHDPDLRDYDLSLQDWNSNKNKILLSSGTGAGGAPGSASERIENNEDFTTHTNLSDVLAGVKSSLVGFDNRADSKREQIAQQAETARTGLLQKATRASLATALPGTQASAAPAAAPGDASSYIRYDASGKRIQ